MKTFLKYAVVVSLAYMVFACESLLTDPVLTISDADKAQAFEAAGGSKTVVVTASAAFTATSDQTWCTVSGLTTAQFKIDVAENTTTDVRTAKVTVALTGISLTGATSVEIAVTQAGVADGELPTAVLAVNPLEFNFATPTAGEKFAKVSTNRPDYSVVVETGKTWVVAEKISADSLKIKVAANTVAAAREATVTVHVEGAKDVVLHVSQAAAVIPANPADPGPAAAKWTVAAPNGIEWYKWGADQTIGTLAGTAPATVAGPEGIQAWACATEDHFKITNPLPKPTTVYTLLWDVRVASLGGFRPLLQTNEDNNDNDADAYIMYNRVGINNYFSDGDVKLTDNTWHRIIVSVDVAATGEKTATFYVDGKLAHISNTGNTTDIDRFTLQNIFWGFLDNNGEDGPIDCAEIALWDKALTAEQAAFLGKLSQTEPPTDSGTDPEPIEPIDPGAASAKWTVAAPNGIAWYKWGANKTIGTAAGTAPATVAGPGGIQAWACATEDHFKITNPLTAPTTVYTLLWDVRVATPGTPTFRPLLQTKEDNNDGDADAYIRGTVVGLGTYSGSVLTQNTWHRIIIAVDIAAESATFYVDGNLVLTKGLTHTAYTDDFDRYTLQSIFWVFLDDDNEDGPIDCAGVALWNKTLTAEEALFLGDATKAVY